MELAEIIKKPYARMVTPDEDGSFFAEIVEFPGCFAVGKTAGDALENLESVAGDWINAALKQGQDIPEPMESNDYSGKLVLRMPKSLHKRAALWAEREGTSLNQFIVTCVAEHVGERARFSSAWVPQPQLLAMAQQVYGIVGGTNHFQMVGNMTFPANTQMLSQNQNTSQLQMTSSVVVDLESRRSRNA